MIHSHINGMIEAINEFIKGFTLASDQGGDHAMRVCGNRSAFDWGDRTDVDVAPGFDELLDVRPR